MKPLNLDWKALVVGLVLMGFALNYAGVMSIGGWFEVTAPYEPDIQTDVLWEDATLSISAEGVTSNTPYTSPHVNIEDYYGDLCGFPESTFNLQYVDYNTAVMRVNGVQTTLTRGVTKQFSNTDGGTIFVKYTTFTAALGSGGNFPGGSFIFGFNGAPSNVKYACAPAGRPLGSYCGDNQVCDAGLWCVNSYCASAPAPSVVPSPTSTPSVTPSPSDVPIATCAGACYGAGDDFDVAITGVEALEAALEQGYTCENVGGDCYCCSEPSGFFESIVAFVQGLFESIFGEVQSGESEGELPELPVEVLALFGLGLAYLVFTLQGKKIKGF